MTIMGKKGGDMRKSVYDTDNSGIVDSAEATPAHKTSHEAGGTDELDLTGLTGAGADKITGDGTTGLVLRQSLFTIQEGTNANTIWCRLLSVENGDTIAAQDNIGKGDTTGNFEFASNGYSVRAKAAGLSGNCVFAWGTKRRQHLAADSFNSVQPSNNDILLGTFYDNAGNEVDLTTLASGWRFDFIVTYITDG